MEDARSKSRSNMPAARIILPVLILAIIGGIWLFKNKKAEESPGNGVINPDFALHVAEKIDLERLKSYGLPVIIDFGADSCLPCKEMAPVLEKLNKKLQGKAIIKFVDVWKYPEIAQGYPIRVIPTHVFFGKDGKPFAPSELPRGHP